VAVFEKTRYPGIRRRTDDYGITTYAIQVRLRGFPAVHETTPALTKALSRREEIKRELPEGHHRQQAGERTFLRNAEKEWRRLGKQLVKPDQRPRQIVLCNLSSPVRQGEPTPSWRTTSSLFEAGLSKSTRHAYRSHRQFGRRGT